MNEMIKAERNKICSRKQTRMLFLAGVVLIVAYFFFLIIKMFSMIMTLKKWHQQAVLQPLNNGRK